jgi:hypothetical protein
LKFTTQQLLDHPKFAQLTGTAAKAPGAVALKPQTANAAPGVRIRQDSKPLMNKLEMEFFFFLQRMPGDIKFIRPQSIRFMLGNGIWFKPDFTGFLDGSYSAWEVKGPHAFRGGFENLKVAAHQYKEIHWHLVWKESGQWKTQKILA